MTVLYTGSPVIRGFIRERIATKRTSALWRKLIEVDERDGYPRPTPAERREWHNPLCARCGHFTSWRSDNYTPFGGPCDTDPPDPEYLCDRCVAIEIAEAMVHRRLWSHWQPAAWEYRVAPLIGFARAGLPGAGWSNWCDTTKPLPDGWVWRNARLAAAA